MLTERKQYYKSENDSRCSMIKNCFKTHKWVELIGNFVVVITPKFYFWGYGWVGVKYFTLQLSHLA